MAEQEQRGNFWIYVWLGVSGLLNLSGMASIIDGFVTWANFFRNFIDVYRATIRQPLAWIGHHVWPFGPIPGWVFDWIVISAAMVLALNIWLYREEGRTVFGWLRDIRKESREYEDIVAFLLAMIIGFACLPLLALVIAMDDDFGEVHPTVLFWRGVLLNFLLLMGAFILILFINWQIRQHGW